MNYLKALSIILFLSIGIHPNCQPGSPVSDFGQNGIFEFDESYLEGFNDFAELSDGSIIAVGYVREFDYGPFSFIMRISADGVKIWQQTIDLSNGAFPSRFHGVVVRNDEIYVMGNYWHLSTQGSFVILKYKINGERDLDFGVNGSAIATQNQGIYGADLLIDQEGSLYIPGNNIDADEGLVVKFRNDGKLDQNFGNAGFSFFAMNAPNTALLEGIIVNQEFYGVGYYGDIQSSEKNGLVVKFNANGSLSENFGNNGSLKIESDENMMASDIALHGNEHFLVLAGRENSTNGTVLNRYHLNGILDANFGTSGSITFGLGQDEQAIEVLVDEKSGIYICGTIGISGAKDFTAVHLNSNGTIDEAFGNGGQAIVSINFDDFLAGGIILKNSNLLLGGSISDGFSSNSAIAVLHGSEGCAEKTNDMQISECDKVDFLGTMYTESGDYTITLKSNDGCDSLVFLHLTIKTSSSESITMSACESILINNQHYSSTGIYTQNLINTNGCDSLLRIDLTIQVLESEVNIQENMLSGKVDNANYQWFDCTTNSIIEGETKQNYTATESGEFALITSLGMCIDTSDCVSVGISQTDQYGFNKAILIYPNPASQGISIVTNNISSIKKIYAFNYIGQKREIQYKVEEDHIDLDLSELNKGMIYIQIVLKDGTSSVRSLLKI